MATIGEELRRERLRKGLSFKDIEQVTHIRSAYLEALEVDDYDIIPGAVYVKGFIRNYANFLGLDGEQLVQRYKVLIGEKPIQKWRPLKEKALSEDTVKDKKEVLPPRLSPEGRMQRRKKRLAQERFVGSILLIVVILFLLWLYFL